MVGHALAASQVWEYVALALIAPALFGTAIAVVLGLYWRKVSPVIKPMLGHSPGSVDEALASWGASPGDDEPIPYTVPGQADPAASPASDGLTAYGAPATKPRLMPWPGEPCPACDAILPSHFRDCPVALELVRRFPEDER